MKFFDIVDENDKIIGKASRKECHTKGLWHRAVHILIINSKGEILLQKRCMKKDLYKGYWTDAASGHVDSGENYEETAKREMVEELGISIKLENLFDCKQYTGNDNEFIRVFLGRHNGSFRINKDEIEFVEFFSFEEIMKMMKTTKLSVELRGRSATQKVYGTVLYIF
ncbi:MAG: NUDIX domain-containing protein [Candidatus Aenigmatarchaeota archaeon]